MKNKQAYKYAISRNAFLCRDANLDDLDKQKEILTQEINRDLDWLKKKNPKQEIGDVYFCMPDSRILKAIAVLRPAIKL